MSRQRGPNAPAHLSREAKAHWKRICTDYELTADAAILLQSALEAWDRSQEARRIVAEQGMVIENRMHPAMTEERLQRASFAQIMRQLGLDVVAPGAMGVNNNRREKNL